MFVGNILNGVYTLYKQCEGKVTAAQIKTWGNSRGVRLSRDILESIGARPDDSLGIEIKNDSIVLSKTFKHRTLEERAVEFDGK